MAPRKKNTYARGTGLLLLCSLLPASVLAALPGAEPGMAVWLPWGLVTLLAVLLLRFAGRAGWPERLSLAHAISRGDIAPWYQPVVCGRRGRTGGVEVLARRMHRGRAPELAGAFIPLAERTGLIVPLMCRLLRQVARDMADTDLPYGFCLSVNAGAGCLRSPVFLMECQSLQKALAAKGAVLVLELTERECLSPAPEFLHLLHTLREEGMRVALDDFGTGWSGPLLLAALPVDYVKLDAAFTANAGQRDGVGDNFLRMAERLIAMAYDAGAEVVAEGVETRLQHAWLLLHGVSWHQGRLYAGALPAEDFKAWLAARRQRPPGGDLPPLPSQPSGVSGAERR